MKRDILFCPSYPDVKIQRTPLNVPFLCKYTKTKIHHFYLLKVFKSKIEISGFSRFSGSSHTVKAYSDQAKIRKCLLSVTLTEAEILVGVESTHTILWANIFRASCLIKRLEHDIFFFCYRTLHNVCIICILIISYSVYFSQLTIYLSADFISVEYLQTKISILVVAWIFPPNVYRIFTKISCYTDKTKMNNY